jgi:hypothetical protein
MQGATQGPFLQFVVLALLMKVRLFLSCTVDIPDHASLKYGCTYLCDVGFLRCSVCDLPRVRN